MDYGKAKAIFGVTYSAALNLYQETCRSFSKRHVLVDMIETGGGMVNDCDILIVDKVSVLGGLKQFIHSEMVVIVCDGPLTLSTVVGLQPLDFVLDASYQVHHKAIDFALVSKAERHAAKAFSISFKKIDLLPSIIDSTITHGHILPALNSIQSILNSKARNKVRRAIGLKLLGKSSDLNDVLEEFRTHANGDKIDALLKVMRTRKIQEDFVPVIRTALTTGKNTSKKILNDKKLDGFELRFFIKMIKQTCPEEVK